MASTIIGCSNAGGTFSSTYYYQLMTAQGAAALFLAEKNAQVSISRGSLTVKNLTIKVTANTFVTDSTLVFRKNEADGNETITIGDGETGYFTDSTHTEDLTNPSRINVKLDTGGGLATSITVQSVIAELETISGPTCYVLGAAYNLYNQGPDLTRYTRVVGNLNASGDAGFVDEFGDNITFKVRASGFAQDFQVSIYQAITASTTITLRRNGADTALSVTIPSGSTTTVIDTSSVFLRAGDLIDAKVVTGAGSGTLRISSISMFIDSMDDQCDFGATGYNAIVAAGAHTDYALVLGDLHFIASEENSKIKIPFDTDIGGLRILISQQPSGLAPAVFTLRVNGVDAGLSLTIPVGAHSGWYQAARSQVVSLSAGDEICVSRVSTNTWNTTIYGLGLTLNYNPTAGTPLGQRGLNC